jgi:1-aminocyclopropane-1-carboxylate deaminase/D-cysteine desulfhydrase-like pyridoxal-dependent ACC family enzyme
MAVKAPLRFALGCVPTPLERAERLERAVGCSPLYIKRDDLIGFALAGNKTRLLEFLIADALERGCTVLLTGGGAASSYCQGAAIAAAVAGLRCVLVMYGEEPVIPHPNLALARAAGAAVRFTGADARESVDSALEAVELELRDAGEIPYLVPRGGATAVAALGYAQAAAELDEQLATVGVAAETVLVAVGSGVTQAGLLAGSQAAGDPWRLVGASVSRPRPEALAQVLRLATECAELLGAGPPEPARVDVRDARGPGYGMPSPEGERAARIALRAGGIIVDPVFTAKAFALLPDVAAEGRGGPTVFWHTGGIPVALAHAVGRPSPS